jgi:exocyst complex protein 7
LEQVHIHEDKKHRARRPFGRAIHENEVQGGCTGVSVHVPEFSVGILDKEELKRLQSKELLRNMVREKMDDFLKGLDEISQRHRWSYSIPDLDLREQIKQSTMKLLVPPYSEFLNTYSAVLQGKLYVQPIEGLLAQIFESDDVKLKRRYSKDRMGGGGNSLTLEREIRDFRRSVSNNSDIV